jgi:beta-lactamase superfamily II metal-dependent hydrolase
MKRTLAMVAFLMIGFSAWAAPLRMFFIDVEGAQSTLIVSPSGESMLIDTGWPGFNGRDANRILEAAKSAGITQIDYVVITHYHDDHVGGVPQLTEKMKVGTFVDHGPNREDSDDTRGNYAAYQKAIGNAKHVVVKPGDRIPISGLDVTVVSANGDLITKPLAGAGQENSLCSSEPAPPTDPSENAYSVGVLISYGKLRVLDLGDLTKKKELGLACPKNLIGKVDLFVVTHHGSAPSNPKALVQAVQPRVAIMDNGARKGGSMEAWQTVHDAPGLVGFWQLHYAIPAGKDHNVPDDFIANVEEKCEGKSIAVTGDADGTLTVSNARNGVSKTYKK